MVPGHWPAAGPAGAGRRRVRPAVRRRHRAVGHRPTAAGDGRPRGVGAPSDTACSTSGAGEGASRSTSPSAGHQVLGIDGAEQAIESAARSGRGRTSTSSSCSATSSTCMGQMQRRVRRGGRRRLLPRARRRGSRSVRDPARPRAHARRGLRDARVLRPRARRVRAAAGERGRDPRTRSAAASGASASCAPPSCTVRSSGCPIVDANLAIIERV